MKKQRDRESARQSQPPAPPWPDDDTLFLRIATHLGLSVRLLEETMADKRAA